MENAIAALPNRRFRMRQVKYRRAPRSCAVAGFAIRAKCTCVKDRVGMTFDTHGGRPCKLGIGVTFFTVNLLVCARQRKVAERVVERGAIPFSWCMAS